MNQAIQIEENRMSNHNENESNECRVTSVLSETD